VSRKETRTRTPLTHAQNSWNFVYIAASSFVPLALARMRVRQRVAVRVQGVLDTLVLAFLAFVTASAATIFVNIGWPLFLSCFIALNVSLELIIVGMLWRG
jgi:hypothetical protein